jgi:fatty acid desaturase
MIDSFKKVATALQLLRIPSLAIGLASLLLLIKTVLGAQSPDGDLYIIPSTVGILWSLATYAFLVNFRSVPEKSDPAWRFSKRLKRNLARGGYWFLGIIFVGVSIAAVIISLRMFSVWLKDYGA